MDATAADHALAILVFSDGMCRPGRIYFITSGAHSILRRNRNATTAHR
jgi:hypothetical protein